MLIEEIMEASKHNARVEGLYVISKCELKPFKQKTGSFLNCELTDKTGSIKGVIWENAEALLKSIQNKCVVKIIGESTRYNDTPQLIIQKIAKTDTYDKTHFLPTLDTETIKKMIEDLAKITVNLKNPFLKSIWEFLILNKPTNFIQGDFKECPGGVGEVHHNYLGGLLEHSANMIKAAQSLFSDSSLIDIETLLTGCLIHDIGKIDAYDWKIVIEMRDRGRLLHHVPLGVLRLSSIIEELYPQQDLTENEAHDLMMLQHIIVSHHEDKESVRKPMTAEAQAVAALDSMDAATNYSANYINNPNNIEKDSNWTRYSLLTERRYYKRSEPEQKIEKVEIKPKKLESESLF